MLPTYLAGDIRYDGMFLHLVVAKVGRNIQD
jgi:hypothetical protein